MSNTQEALGSETQNSNGAGSPESTGGKGRRALRAVGRAAAKASAFDVLARDIKRTKPLAPNMWRDVFSKKGWQALKWRLSIGETRKTKATDLIAPFVSFLVGAAVAGYCLVMIIAHPNPQAIPELNKIVLVLMLLTSAVFMSAHAYIGIAQLKRKKEALSSRGEKTK